MQATSGEEYSSYSFLTSALDGVSGQRHAPALLYLLTPQAPAWRVADCFSLHFSSEGETCGRTEK
jgi:hypothetical protein